LEEIRARLKELEEQNRRLAEQNARLGRSLEEVSGRHAALQERLERLEPGGGSGGRVAGLGVVAGDAAGLPPALPAVNPLVVPGGESIDRLPGGLADYRGNWWPAEAAPGTHPEAPSRFLVGDHDAETDSFVLVRPRDPAATPFELRLDIFTQARYTNFARSARDWIDSAGNLQPVRNISSIEVMRNFLWFQGYGLDPRLNYSLIIFSSTASNDTVYLGWLGYRFNDALEVRVGNWQVPGTREWLESFRYTMGSDRLMATTFFRPNISPGVWFQGSPVENVRYVVMLANSLNRFSQGVERIQGGLSVGGTLVWEPRGDFGPGPSDQENHQELSTRWGTSFAFSRERNQRVAGGINLSNPEDTILRLSDGTPLFRTSALGPGVELEGVAYQLWAVDAAMKYRGWSVAGEYLFRHLGNFDVLTGDPEVTSLFDHGGLLQSGYFLVPGRVEAFARTSFVTGRYGTGEEYGGGLNWYVQGTRNWRMTFEVLRVNHSPAQNILTGYRAGASGTLFQLQWFTDF
jgi:hypothetical protein